MCAISLRLSLLHLTLEALGILEEQILGFRLRLLASPLLLPRLKVADLGLQALSCLRAR